MEIETFKNILPEKKIWHVTQQLTSKLSRNSKKCIFLKGVKVAKSSSNRIFQNLNSTFCCVTKNFSQRFTVHKFNENISIYFSKNLTKNNFPRSHFLEWKIISDFDNSNSHFCCVAKTFSERVT
jgi:hypothetical protein